MGVVKTKAAFDTQTVVVGRAVTAIDTHNFVVFDVVGQQTTDAAKRTHRIHFFVNDLAANLGLRHQRTGWAGLDTFAAGHASALAHRIIQIKNDFAV